MPDFNNTFIWNEPAIGSGASSIGSNIFVLHSAAASPDAKWNEPLVLAGSGTNSYVCSVPYGLNLEMYICSSTEANHTFEIGVFGKTPVKSGATGSARNWPNDLSASFEENADFWIPLQNLEADWVAKDNPTEATDQANFITMSLHSTAAMTDDRGMFLGPRTAVYTAGCTHVVVGVKSDDSHGGTAMVLGRFVG